MDSLDSHDLPPDAGPHSSQARHRCLVHWKGEPRPSHGAGESRGHRQRVVLSEARGRRGVGPGHALQHREPRCTGAGRGTKQRLVTWQESRRLLVTLPAGNLIKCEEWLVDSNHSDIQELFIKSATSVFKLSHHLGQIRCAGQKNTSRKNNMFLSTWSFITCFCSKNLGTHIPCVPPNLPAFRRHRNSPASARREAARHAPRAAGPRAAKRAPPQVQFQGLGQVLQVLAGHGQRRLTVMLTWLGGWLRDTVDHGNGW